MVVDTREFSNLENKTEKKFVKLFFNNEFLVGAVLINDVENAGFYKQLITKRKIIKEHLSEINLGLEDRLDTRVKLLSGGQRQALTLLMATIIEPEILLLDEHTAALDPATAIKIKDLTEQIIDNHNITTLMITHDMKDALRFGNRMLMMNRGKIIFDVNGKTKENMTINHLLEIFQKKHKEGFYNDRSILSLA